MHSSRHLLAESAGGVAIADASLPRPWFYPHQFDQFICDVEFGTWEIFIKLLIVLALAALAYVCVSHALFRAILAAAGQQRWSDVLARPSVMWLMMGIVLLVFRTLLWFRYRPFAPMTAQDAPSLTVIIPAYNEGAMVTQSINSVTRADYPRHLLQILVVDDGSSDDTWQHIVQGERRYPNLVTAIRLERNQGKRAALAEGFRRARGTVVVTVDSDSIIENQALLAIVAPFRDRSVGAVAGKVVVYNSRAGLIPKMLRVRFALSFDFLRAVQSTFGTVNCCPGALSAYRTDVVRAVLDSWLNQMFFGASCTIGEDRALTNYILGCGFNCVYQRTAVVRTMVPEQYVKLAKMYLRWDRSYVREECRLLRIVWKRPFRQALIAFIDQLFSNFRYPVAYASLILLVRLSLHDPTTIPRMLVAMGIMSAFYMLYFLRSERSWEFLYGILYSYFYLFTLFWIFPCAVLTVRARGWLTR